MNEPSDKTVTTWKGRDIRELSREELIEALTWATRAYHDALNNNIRTAKVMVTIATSPWRS